ncbi:MAG TPA: substrate-binding domain-containing protein [Allosphingosinicella sp.]|jgi:mxaJ protein
MRLLLALALTIAPAVAGARELKVCADPNNMPFSDRAGDGFENKLVEMVAAELHASVTYTWWAQRRGNVRETLNEGLCDLIPGVGATLEMLGTTRPYYRSTYVAITRAGEPPVASFDDERLRTMKIGVQMVGDDFSNTPPAHALSKRGMIDNIRGYMIYGDHGAPDPQAAIVEAVAKGEVDVAFVWGPVAGWYAARQKVPLTVTALTSAFDGPQLPMVFDVSMGTRKGDRALREEVETALARRAPEIRALLQRYHVPLAEEQP